MIHKVMSVLPEAKSRRRPRYRGTHPRHFSEKYKELNREQYPEEIKKLEGEGKTPAGSHRPICLSEILALLAPKPGEIAVDGTLGFGGHSQEILKALTPGGRLYGFDLDSEELVKTEKRLRDQGFSESQFKARHGNFSSVRAKLDSLKVEKVDIFLADLGMSSMQIDNPTRGFSFKIEAPLDMRLNQKSSGITAAELLDAVSERALVKILQKNADEIYSEEIAKFIKASQEKFKIKTTTDLVKAIREALQFLPKHVQAELCDKSVRRTFQALRIAVNEELRSLNSLLEDLPLLLKSKGRAAFLTFHSGEDRLVKKAFQKGLREKIYSSISDEVIRPKSDEIYSNPRASSAKLRWAIRC